MAATAAGYSAFRQSFMLSGSDDSSVFGEWAARKARYGVLWSYFEGKPYHEIQSHAQGLKQDGGLYKAIRSIYNPAGRIGEFYATHLLGGPIKYNADGGLSDYGAMPIVTDNNALRVAMGDIARASNWQVNKRILALRGSVLGDAALKVVDEGDRVYIQTINPAWLVDVDLDGRGYVRGYKIEYTRTDPEWDEHDAGLWDAESPKSVTYTETAEREDGTDEIVYTTYKNRVKYAWNDAQGAEWSEPYGFVPLVLLQHNNVGLQWGWSHFHKSLSKFDEANDQASKLDDQIRKSVDPIWLFSGVNPNDVSLTRDDVRQDMPGLYGPEGVTAQALIASVDIAGVTNNLQSILAEIENDYPETRLVRLVTSGESSGEAIRQAQQPVEAVVNELRSNYDSAVLSAFLMAVSIAGYRGLVDGFDLDSYHAGNMLAQVGERPVFSQSDEDKLAREKSEAETAKAFMDIGYDPEFYLADRGWSDARIAKLKASGTYRNATFAQYP